MNRQLITQRRLGWLGGIVAIAAVIIVVAVVTTGDSEATPPDGSPVAESSNVSQLPSSSSGASTAIGLTTSTAPGRSTSPAKSGGTSPTTSLPPATANLSPTVSSVPSTSVHVVPTDTIEVLPPIDLDMTGSFGTGLVVEVTSITAIDGVARQPGEIAGPALRVEIRLTNESTAPIGVTAGLIDVTYGQERTPASTLGQPDVIAMPSSLAPGESAAAAGVFVVPLDARDQIQVAVTSSTDAPIIVFEGAAPRA